MTFVLTTLIFVLVASAEAGAQGPEVVPAQVQQMGLENLTQTLALVEKYGIVLVGVVGLELLVIFVFLALFFLTMRRNSQDNAERVALTQTLIDMLKSTTAAMTSLKSEVEDLRRDTTTSFVNVANLIDKQTGLILEKSQEAAATHERMRAETAGVQAEVKRVRLDLARLEGKKEGAAETGATFAAAGGGPG